MTNDTQLPTDEVAKLIHDIKLGKLVGSYNKTTSTVAIFKEIITKSKWSSAEELLQLVRGQGRVLVAALPQEPVTANVARRVLKLIREEYEALQTKVHTDDSQTSLSLHKLVTQSETESHRDYSKPQDGLMAALLDQLQEIETELETSGENLTAQAAEHIHSSELIMTIGYSKCVEIFLKKAAKQRKFELVVAECAPSCSGHTLAANLAKFRIETTVIHDSAIFAMMSRVNKVIIGTHSVFADGGLQAACGSYTVALAAKHYSVPVIVLVPTYKLSPVHFCSFELSFNLVGCAEGVIPYNSLSAKSATAYNPLFDHVPPKLVTLFISNIGGNAPSYVYRLLSELYHAEDYDL